MEDVLNVLARPYDARQPVVGFDERPVALRGASRPGRPMRPGQIARDGLRVRPAGHCQYLLHRGAEGRPARDACDPRPEGAPLRPRPPTSRPTIPEGQDDSSHHGQLEPALPGTVIGILGSKQGAALWVRFTPHYTPKHGSWLNPAEIEASLWSRECHGRDRVDTFEALRDRTRAWTARADRARRKINWRFTTAKARRVFRYKRRSTMSRSRH